MALTADQRRTRAKVAALTRHAPDHPDIAQGKRDLRAARLEEYVRRTVAAAPPLTADQRDRIAALLSADGGGAT